MKKIILIPIIIIILCSLCFAFESSIKSLLGIPFGEECTIKAEFVDKPNTYYAQNISHSDNYLKIYEINNRKLSNPLIVEPVYKNLKIIKNKIYTFRAYETIESQNEPMNWSNSNISQQVNYLIIQKVVIKLP